MAAFYKTAARGNIANFRSRDQSDNNMEYTIEGKEVFIDKNGEAGYYITYSTIDGNVDDGHWKTEEEAKEYFGKLAKDHPDMIKKLFS